MRKHLDLRFQPWLLWQDGVPYDPARRRALQLHITVTIPTASGAVVDQAATERMGPSCRRLPTAFWQTGAAQRERPCIHACPPVMQDHV